ncbi:MAG: 30S ribosomal protein S20 [bacterium]
MPHHKSAKKRLAKSKLQRLRNRDCRAAARNQIRDFRKAVGSDAELDKPKELSRMYGLLDTQVRKGVMNKKKASRLKSRLSTLTQG